MKKPAAPNNEEQRLHELNRLKILDTKPEAEFDEITRLAATICDVKIALISLVDENRQWFKSRFGLEATETPKDISFCGHAILTDKVFEVPNAELHPDFCDNPLFLGEPHVRFYAGAPLITKNGFRIGTLCVIDDKEKSLNEVQKKTLEALAKQVVGTLELKVIQAEAQFINDQLERAQATAKVGSWQFDLRTHEQWWSKEHYKIFEIDSPQLQDVLHKLYRQRIHPDDLPHLDHLVERAVNQGEDFIYDHRVYLDGGQRIKYVQGIGKVVKDSSGKPVLINGTCQDMTISYHLKEIKAYNTFYKIALDEAAIVAMTDIKGKIIYVNELFCKISEYSREELLGKDHRIINSGKMGQYFFKQMWDTISSGQKWSGKICNRAKSGREYWVDTTIVPFKDKNGTIENFIAIRKDITSEIIAEQALRIKTKETDSFFSVTLDLLCVAGTDGMFKRVNPAFTKVLGYAESELLSQPFFGFIHPDDVPRTQAEVEKLKVGAPTIQFENRYKCKDGSYKVLSWAASPDPETGLLYAAARDATSDRQASQVDQTVSNIRAQYIRYKHSSKELFDFILSNLIRESESGYAFIGEIKIDPVNNQRYLKTFSLTNIAWSDETKALFEKHATNGGGLEFKNLDTLFGSVIKSGKHLITNDASNHEHARGLPKGHPPLSQFWGIPIYHGGEFIGMAGLANRKTGYEEKLQQTMAPLIGAIGEIMFAYLSEREAIEQKKKLNIALEQAQLATQAKSDFLSTMSHEIRTPLNGVIGMADLLLDTHLSNDQIELARTIASAGQNLRTIINDVLDFSKIEAGQLELEPTEFDIVHYTRELLKPFTFSTESKGISFDIKACDFKRHVITDEGRFGQIMTNLVGNAIKFTKSGGVRIEQEITEQGDFADVIISVHDTGVGIPEAARERMFKAFSQAEQSTGRNFGGTGLGLSIAKRLVDLMKGSISFESKVGIGTTFIVKLKLKAGTVIRHQSQIQIQSESQIQSQKVTGRILVAEDNPTNQMVITRMLDKWGCKYHVVANGNEVIDAMRDAKFDLILMDCQMPEMDGYQATQNIRNSSTLNREIPIVALTANAVQGDQEKCQEAGMNGYLTKPIDRSALKATLLKYLHAKDSAAIQPLVEKNILMKLQDLEEDGQDAVVDFIDLFIRTSQVRIKGMAKCIEKNDVVGAAREAHNLKSSAQTLGAKKLGSACQMLEDLNQSRDLEKISRLFKELNEIYLESCAEFSEIKRQRTKAAERKVS